MYNTRPTTDYALQNSLVHVLAEKIRNQPVRGRVRLLETHISWVLLAGQYAYKIKKALNLGFLNFSSLQARQYYCNEEIRLNRRLAPAIYLDVISIGGSPENPRLDAQPPVEYAVRMRRFPGSGQLDRLAAKGKLLPQHIDSLAATIARFHRDLPAADFNAAYGTDASVSRDALQNFEQLQGLLTKGADLEKLAALRHASDSEYAACRSLLRQRLAQGFIRECHGDLHLGNIVLLDGQPTPFDGIEFNPALRWIDVMSEAAFTVMDLLHHRRTELAFRFLNAYLEITGDYAGIRLLRFYTAYRAMVRAKVSAIRAAQPGLSHRAASGARAACRGYLKQAADCFASKRPALIITHGLPGSGKSTFAQMALERLQAIRLRSDVERKRLYGLGPLADSYALAGVDLYSAGVTQRTYARLDALARELLLAGYPVIVDAAFITQNERAQFRLLAEQLSVPYVIASVYASRETLHARIVQRQRAANDASEADIAVMEKLMQSHEPLSAAERESTAEFCNEGAGIVADAAGWSRLQQLLGS
jgi:aminoglycoside phosphotransferase family enzyme/predicted kinase